jgi:hypothetical protein
MLKPELFGLEWCVLKTAACLYLRVWGSKKKVWKANKLEKTKIGISENRTSPKR